MNLNGRRLVTGSSSRISVPVILEGMRSGVNWIRLNLRSRILESVETSSVLESPGTPTRRQWPFAKSTVRSCSTTVSCPTMTLRSSVRIALRASLRSSRSFRSSFGTACVMVFSPRSPPRGHSGIERRYAPRFHHVHKGGLRHKYGLRKRVKLLALYRYPPQKATYPQRSAFSRRTRVLGGVQLVLGHGSGRPL